MSVFVEDYESLRRRAVEVLRHYADAIERGEQEVVNLDLSYQPHAKTRLIVDTKPHIIRHGRVEDNDNTGLV
jgi:hypothetical protein